MSPSERRNAILDVLCVNRYETVSNLATLFNVSERTIRHDILVLSCSYPIYTVRGRYGGGIYISDWYRTSNKTLTKKQIELLKRIMHHLEGEDRVTMKSILILFVPIKDL